MLEQPRTLLISPFFDAALPSGGVLHSVNVAQEWLRRGRPVAVLCGQRSRQLGDLQPFVDQGQLTLHPIASAEQLRFSHHLHPEVAEQAEQVIRAFRPDIVHVHNFQGMLAAVRLAVDSPIPVVLTAVDLGLLCFNFCLYDGTATPCTGPVSAEVCVDCIGRTIRGWAGWVGPSLPRGVTRKLWPRFVRLDQIQSVGELQDQMRYLLRALDAIITPSPIVASKLEEFGAPAERVLPMVYGLPPWSILRPAKVPSETMRLAYLGGCEPIKGFSVVAAAADLLADGLALEIRVFGGEAMRDAVARCTPSAKRYLRHVPPVFGPSLAAEHARIDAVLVPSLCHDNSPFVVLEALANGTAVLAADQAGIRHLIEPGRTGRLIPPGDAAAWCDAMTRAARQPREIRQMQERARFSRTVAQFVDDLAGLEQKLLSRHVVPAASPCGVGV